jgi:hypothetical protein
MKAHHPAPRQHSSSWCSGSRGCVLLLAALTAAGLASSWYGLQPNRSTAQEDYALLRQDPCSKASKPVLKRLAK